jgi:hypothetical protein
VDIQEFNEEVRSVMVTYNLRADGNYTSEADRAKLGLPILRECTRIRCSKWGSKQGQAHN